MSRNNISTKDNPIAFFEYFLEKGFIKFRNNFFGIKDFGNSDLFAEEKKQPAEPFSEIGIWSITEEEKNAGDSGTFIHFSDELNGLLKKELNITLSLIKDSYLHFVNKGQKQYYANTLISRLNDLIDRYQALELSSKYLDIEHYFEVIIEALKTDNKEETATSIKSIQKGFSMYPKYYSKIDMLYGELVENKFIDRKSRKIVFKNAFNGHPLPEKPRLIWLNEGKNKTVNKSLIIKFIEHLIAYDIIEPIYESEFKIIIPKIFLDEEKHELKNIQETYSQLSDTITDDEELLKKIISEFRNNIELPS